MPRPLTLGLLVVLAVVPTPAGSNGDGTAVGPPTVFERFVLSACSPCVRESFPIATLPVAPFAVAGLPRGVSTSGTRSGEIAIEVLRARQPTRPDWRSVALRVTLSVATGQGGELFRLGTGLLDGADARALAQAVGEMVKSATGPSGDPRADTVDTDFHGGTLRIGVLRLRGDAVGYVQTGDLPVLLQRAVWEVPTTLYVPVKDLTDVATALGQAAARIEQVGSN
jgi:hypothetical protein